MNKNRILFEDMTFNSSYELLELGKGKDDELKEIAEKREIKMPSKDIAIFKCVYAMVDEENRNKCTLPKKEVKKAIGSLNGKAIDKDHLRKSTVGTWLDAKMVGDDIVAYGAFWKSNFPEDYEDIKKRMSEGKMKISFEAWGDRIFKEEGKYDLTNIEFAGGALLFDSEPAFPNAEVLEFSSKSNQVLEFAKVIEEKEISTDGGSSNQKEETKVEKIKEETKVEKIEEAKLMFNWDDQTIARLMYECECPECKEKGWFDVNSIDFDSSEVSATCGACKSKLKTKLVPSMVVTKKGKKIENSSKDSNTENAKEGAMQTVDKTIEEMKQEVAALQSKVAEMTQAMTAKDQEIASLKSAKEAVDAEFAQVKTAYEAKLAQEKAAIVAARKVELAGFAEGLSDEDILDELKFENAKLKKEIASLKKEEGSVRTDAPALEAGKKGEILDPVFAVQKRIREKAFGTTED